jgi:dipeptidyl aminopeptidase/acylaminoacyl peptidase
VKKHGCNDDNMKYYTGTLFLFINSFVFGQKPPLDTSVFNSWSSVVNGNITKTGEFAMYTLINEPEGKSTVVLQATSGHWKKSIVCDKQPETKLSLNGKYCVIKAGDNIKILKLGHEECRIIAGVNSYKINFASQQVICYTLKLSPHSVILFSFDTGEEQSFENVAEYNFSPTGKKLLFQINQSKNSEFRVYDLNKRTAKLIVNDEVKNIKWHTTRELFVFFVKQPDDKRCLFQYNCETNRLALLADDFKLIDKYSFPKILGVSRDEKLIFFKYDKEPHINQCSTKNEINIWSYLNNDLSDEDLVNEKKNDIIFAFNVSTKKYTLLQAPGETLQLFSGQLNDNVGLLEVPGVYDISNGQNKKLPKQYFFISTESGSRKQTKKRFAWKSPGGHFFIGVNEDTGNLTVHSIEKDKEYNFVEDIFRTDSSIANDQTRKYRFQITSWLPQDSAFFVSDGFDIWKVNSAGKEKPINICRGYGATHNITFTISNHQIWDNVLRPNKNLIILNAKNITTKDAGFFRCSLYSDKDPELLYMGAYSFGELSPNFSNYGQIWSHSGNSNSVITTRENSHESPNYFSTEDFIHFKPISYNYPERKFNWMSSYLISYETSDGKNNAAAIYKPEDFNYAKKYPVILYYYEELTDKINQYHEPELFNGGINISWFVSHGYIVCTPDIINNAQNPGKTAINSVLGVYNYLKKLSWIDSNNVAICGHSFGGFETNCILASTNVFKAAFSAASLSNLISFYNSVVPDGSSRQDIVEIGQISLQSALWKNPNLYVDNSAVFDINKISTPVLMMANRDDWSVPFTQSIEFYLASRKLQKQSWLLEYVAEGHTLSKYQNRMDLTLKLTQYFDHFLKNKKVPAWLNN